MDTETEMEQELENLVEVDGDGPADTACLQVYRTAQQFTNIEQLEQARLLSGPGR